MRASFSPGLKSVGNGEEERGEGRGKNLPFLEGSLPRIWSEGKTTSFGSTKEINPRAT
jgi:hypothetical protein